MRKTTSWVASLAAAVLAAGAVNAAEPAAAKSEWPLWDGKESVADYAKRAGIKDLEMNLDLGSNVSMKLTLVPAGKFTMGALVERHEGGASWQTPAREVTLSKPFYMGVYEVTQEQFERIMGADPKRDSRYEDANARDKDKTSQAWIRGKAQPEGLLAWNEAAEFCEKLSAKTGMRVWLPTEAQWEFACRAGSNTRFPWGDDAAEVHTYANFVLIKKGETRATAADGGGGVRGTAPVGSFKPNNFGLYDMLGNVDEWCNDWFTHDYVGAPTLDPAGPGISPPGTHAGMCRVWRGSGFSSIWNWPLTIGRSQHAANPLCGFRVAVTLGSTVAPAQKTKEEDTLKTPAATTAPGTARAQELTLRVPVGCRAAAGAQAEPYTKSGWAQAVVHEATGLELVYIPAGNFLMSSPESESGRSRFAGREGPQHRVTLTKGFYLGKTEVTQAQWEKVMGFNPSLFKGAGRELPVDTVGWKDCRTFCEKAGGGLRLPTEAEWEYACRAGTQGPYAGDLDEMGWYLGNSDGATHPVGGRKPNAWGLYDMHGNVWEWCQDIIDKYSNEAVTDPAGPEKDGERVLRGGSWAAYASDCRSAARGCYVGKSYAQNQWQDAQAARGWYNSASQRPDFGCRFVITATAAP